MAPNGIKCQLEFGQNSLKDSKLKRRIARKCICGGICIRTSRLVGVILQRNFLMSIENNCLLQKAFSRYSLYLVGSTISGFGLDTSDVDMCLVSRCFTNLDSRSEAMMHLSLLRDHLQTTSGIFDHFNLIQAKVPILRFNDTLHKLEIDLNFNNCVGIRNTHLLHCYGQSECSINIERLESENEKKKMFSFQWTGVFVH